MKRAITIIGRFALGGWALLTGALVLVALVSAVVSGDSGSLSDGWLVVSFFVYSFIGIAGGAVVGLLAAVLDRLIKPPASKSSPTREAASEANDVWPPAPEVPETIENINKRD